MLIPSNLFMLKPELKKMGKVELDGKKLIRMKYREKQIDLYLANRETFETLKLIRTGSSSHNIKLCTIAKERGWHLFADGRGLYNQNKNLISNSEKGILVALLGKFVKPEERD